MKHLGDITQINGAQIEPVDCITFGSPCQDLSVAGRREGLAGQRSGLFLEAVRVIKEMREATNGLYPTFAVWENVPGAFSSNRGEDFRTVLEELARIAEPDAAIPRFEGGRWMHAGYIEGNGFSAAWRLLDAQYWGVPQRRKRIALVVDFAGQRAGEILFERESLRGHSAQGIPPWQGIARDPAPCIGTDDSRGKVFDARGNGGGGTAPTLTGDQNAHLGDHTALYVERISGTLTAEYAHSNFHAGQGATVCERKIFVPKTAATLKSRYDGSPNRDGSAPHICEAAGFSYGQSEKARSIGYEEGRAPTLRGGEGGNQKPCVIYCLQGNCIDRNAAQNGAGVTENVSYTLDAADRHAVAYAVDCRHGEINAHTNGTLQTAGSGGMSANKNSVVLCRATAQANAETLTEQCPTLNCDHEQPIVITRWIARRLTPLECERLQGYPDGWTDIGEWTDSKGKCHKPADTPRYKALGNSIALPQWWWLVCKMGEYLPAGATLGSLFDGIGGFPLVWETLHGKGTARWASEIEEFCIAVTKRRLSDA